MPKKAETAVIAGAGPAGLTAALELLRHTDIRPIVLEADSVVGGISRTVEYNGNRMDIGGHRFFSKSQEVLDRWMELMPLQGAPAQDEKLLGENFGQFAPGGPDPDSEDRVMLRRRRVSRIYFLRKFFDYPISMKRSTFANMGFRRVLKAGCGYLWSCVHKLPEDSLENFYINRFGRPLYEMFFEAYTEKVWGVHPSSLGADWGSQRVKGLSVRAVLKDMLAKASGRKNGSSRVETSLIEEFIYPKFGPGQLWQTVADEIRAAGGEVRLDSEVIGVHCSGGKVTEVEVRAKDGGICTVGCDWFLSTMPLKDLVPRMKGVELPPKVLETATALPYRDFITVGLCVDKLKIRNETALKTWEGRIPDTWIYIQDRDVKLGRLQVFNNWSPYLVKDYRNSVWLGLEYFCTEGDEMWTMSDAEFIAMAEAELVKTGIIEEGSVKDACRVKIRKAYPAYFGSYYELDCVKDFLNGIPNLFCLGRNGQHRYNNMDHSMLTAIECVRAIASGHPENKTAVWNVNTEEEYHEEKHNN
ncbi:MAG: NAD(P)/FAD-dependent oxidoreductase [Bacteroidales bacterium]|nr:NAD(P)/FAD-dependent oxidoreductase [Bacteroidales bacterium]